MSATANLACRTAKGCCLLLVAVVSVQGLAAEAASPSAANWQPKGTRGSAPASSASSPSDDVWRLPNGQVVPANNSANTASGGNAPWQNQQAAAVFREPRAMSAPANAKPIAASQSTDSAARSAAQRAPQSSAVMQTAAAIPAGRPANVTMNRPVMQQQPMMQQQPAGMRVARAMPPSRSAAGPSTSRMWQRMNVAMNGPELSGESEDLPMPTSRLKTKEGGDPFGSDPNSYYLEGEEMMVPGGCGPGGCGPACDCGNGCCGSCGCGEVCGCGDGCEPSCGCGEGECCNDCLSIGPGDPDSCHSVRIRTPKWQELNVFGGVQGFKGPYDQSRDAGNFGFHEGFNSGFKIPYTYAGYQIGYEAVQSQINGTESPPSNESHTQHFTTFGLFRRTQDGLQFGSAWDTLVDRRQDTRTFHQIRSELSWLDACTHEFGAMVIVGVMDHEDQDDEGIVWEATDQYTLFYRLHGKRGGEGRLYAGFTEDSDGILGADMLLPVHDRWSVQTGFTYMIPDAGKGPLGASEEAWNISLAMVWHWGCTARSSHCNPYRPLFNVANNGYMIIDSHPNSMTNSTPTE